MQRAPWCDVPDFTEAQYFLTPEQLKWKAAIDKRTKNRPKLREKEYAKLWKRVIRDYWERSLLRQLDEEEEEAEALRTKNSSHYATPPGGESSPSL